MIVDELITKHYEDEMEDTQGYHIPVMLDEVIECLKPKANDIFVDCTLGLGSHAEAILNLIGPRGRLVGIDRDGRSLDIAKEKLRPYLQQCDFIQEDFRNVDNIFKGLNIRLVDGVLFDLGVSSYQLNNPQRGFSIRSNGPLDMRLDQESHITAFDLINSLSEKEISLILKNFGQERWHYRIAHQLISERSKHPIETTTELRRIVLKSIPYRRKRTRIHPATRTFQAFRIAVNRELEALDMALDKYIDLLKRGGRMGVIAFHSLEDRIVKQKFRDSAKAGKIKLLVKKPLRPSEAEAQQNPRSRSARFRVAERI